MRMLSDEAVVGEGPPGPDPGNLLDVRNIEKSYGGARVLQSVSLHVRRGERISLIGPNGAGKTTLFNIITRLESADSGAVQFDGVDLMAAPAHKLSAMGIARTFQHSALFDSLSVEENVGAPLMVSERVAPAAFRLPSYRARQRDRDERVAHILKSLKLEGVATERIDTLPYVTLRRIEIAKALVTEPRMLILDEPAAGLTKSDVGDLEDLLRSLQSEHGLALLLIEHNMRFVMNLSDRIYVLDHGTMIAHGQPADIASNPEVVSAYLGTRTPHV